jgi:hypothetical protein
MHLESHENFQEILVTDQQYQGDFGELQQLVSTLWHAVILSYPKRDEQA